MLIAYTTGNYSRVHQAFCGFTLKELDGMEAQKTLPILKKAAEKLGTNRHENHWAPGPGNAGAAPEDLLRLIDLFPDGVLQMD